MVEGSNRVYYIGGEEVMEQSRKAGCCICKARAIPVDNAKDGSLWTQNILNSTESLLMQDPYLREVANAACGRRRGILPWYLLTSNHFFEFVPFSLKT
jgi:hypothetical protein